MSHNGDGDGDGKDVAWYPVLGVEAEVREGGSAAIIPCKELLDFNYSAMLLHIHWPGKEGTLEESQRGSVQRFDFHYFLFIFVVAKNFAGAQCGRCDKLTEWKKRVKIRLSSAKKMNS